MRRIAAGLLLCLGFALVGARCSHLPIDASANAAVSNDATVVVQVDGCGAQPVVGYAYCRKTEGDPTTEQIALRAPAADCEGSGPCVSFRVHYPDGAPALGLEVPRGETKIAVPWSALTKKSAFERDDRGIWGIAMRWRYKGADGLDRDGYAEGEIRLRVLARGYVPLHEVRDDPSFGWRWNDGPWVVRFSTAGRSFAGAR